ncbi:MAG: MBL fold metallo-hydrolase [Chloroflexota bacterium]
MQKFARNVYVETKHHGSNNSFVVTSEGVVMIDTPQMPLEAIKWRDEIKKYGEVRYVINTEPHGDHHAGNYFFGGAVVAHEGTRQAILSASLEQFKERIRQQAPENLPYLESFKFRPPTITFSERLTLHLGEHTFNLIHMPGHSASQLAVFVPEEKTVFTSDNVVYRAQAWLHESLPNDWLKSLKKLAELDADVVVPGHGNICDRSYIPEMSAFVRDWVTAVRKAIRQGMSLEQAQNTISFLDRYPMAPGYEAMGQMIQSMNVARLYQVLKK